MGQPNDLLDLDRAWAALAGPGRGEGWRTTEVRQAGPCRILGARRLPEDREAVLFGFEGLVLTGPLELPAGQGFATERVRDAPAGFAWIAVSRRDGASQQLFSAMAHDLVGALRAGEAPDGASLFRVLLGRVQAWQAFMLRVPAGVLGAEQELGLHGELHVLDGLLDLVADAVAVIRWWEGPLGGLHDFVPRTGAIETKASTSPSGFRATIDSLDQLDTTIRSPLHVAAVRLHARPDGSTLGERVEQIRERLGCSPEAVREFETRILRAGYADALAERYTDRFRAAGMRVLRVDDRFPRLTRGSVPRGVVASRYVVDLDAVPLHEVPLRAAVHSN